MSTERGSRLRQWWSTPVARALLALLLMVAIGCIFSADGTFYRWSVHRDMLRQVSVFGILACGMTVVIISAGIDLSVSSMLGIMGRMVGYTGKRITWDQAINSTQKLGLDKYSMDATPPVVPNQDGKFDVAVPGVTPFV